MPEQEKQAKKAVLADLLARGILSNADGMHDLLRTVIQGKGLKAFPAIPGVVEWLSLYRSPRRVGRGISQLFAQMSGMDFTHEECLAARAEYRLLCEMDEAERKAALESEDPQEWPSSSMQCEPEITPECQFLVRVWMPCFMLYRDYPSRMLARARRGDVNVLCDLVKLDKAIIHEPRIAEQVHQWANSARRGLFNKFARAFRERPRVPNEKQIKYALAGLVSHFIGTSLGMTATEIRQLYDRLAYEKTGGRQMIDTDLPAQQETFSKAVQRIRKTWNILPPDKSRSR